MLLFLCRRKGYCLVLDLYMLNHPCLVTLKVTLVFTPQCIRCNASVACHQEEYLWNFRVPTSLSSTPAPVYHFSRAHPRTLRNGNTAKIGTSDLTAQPVPMHYQWSFLLSFSVLSTPS